MAAEQREVLMRASGVKMYFKGKNRRSGATIRLRSRYIRRTGRRNEPAGK